MTERIRTRRLAVLRYLAGLPEDGDGALTDDVRRFIRDDVCMANSDLRVLLREGLVESRAHRGLRVREGRPFVGRYVTWHITRAGRRRVRDADRGIAA